MPSFLRRLAVPALFVLMLAVVTGAQAAGQGNAGAVDRALDHVRGHAAASHFDPEQTLAARDVVVDAGGSEHVRFDRFYRGLRVIGGDLVVHSDESGSLDGFSQTLGAVPAVATTPGLSGEAAARRAAARFAGSPTGAVRAELVVYARSFAPVLAYEAVVEGELADGSPSELHVVVGAETGEILDSWDGVETATGTGNGFYSGVVSLQTTPIAGGYRLTDPTRGNQFTCDMRNRQANCYYLDDADNLWGSGTLSNPQSVAVDAQYGTAVTWDYYLAVHGRNGIANDGRGSYNRVHFGRKYSNANWNDSCFCMTYGDGDGRTYNPFDSLDVAGHEMTHGVTSRTARLTYSGESGGLNEATSDIFGSMVEYYAGNARDTGDYKIGEKLYVSNPGETKALRYMYRPSLDGASADCWFAGVGSLNVHYSSGVGNHFFYLLAEGSNGTPASPTCNGSTVTGIGRDAAARIWYRALTVYMTSSTSYAGARVASLKAAADLYGGGSAEYAAVAAAWAAVSVN